MSMTTMLPRILATLRGRRLQAYQITSWCRAQSSAVEAQELARCLEICPLLITRLETVIQTLSYRETGALYAVLCKAIFALCISMTISTTNLEVHASILQLKVWIEARCPKAALCEKSLIRLAIFTAKAMRHECEHVPAYEKTLQDARSQHPTIQQVRKVFQKNYNITMRISLSLFQASLSQLRKQYSFREMLGFVSAYRREDLARQDTLPMSSNGPAEFGVDDTETEYKAVGPRIGLSKFCSRAESVSSGAECSLCMSEIDETGPGQPVITKCEHLYHELCLDKWINDSAMKTSNTCPTCRTVLCEPRQRMHASMEGPTARRIGNEDHNSDGEGTLHGDNELFPDSSSSDPAVQSRVQIVINTGPTTYLGIVSVDTEPPAGNGRVAGTSGTVPNFAALQESFEAVNADRRVETIRIVNI